MTDNKIWYIRYDGGDKFYWKKSLKKPEYAESHWKLEVEKTLPSCPQCDADLFAPEAPFLFWEDYRQKFPLIANEGFGGLAMQKQLAVLLAERFAGVEFRPLKFDYTDRLRNEKYKGQTLTYDGPEVCFLYPTFVVWPDFADTGWKFTCQCSRCGQAEYVAPETAPYAWSIPYFKIPASQVRGKEIFRLYGRGLGIQGIFCTSVFKAFLEENGVDTLRYADVGEIYDDGDSFVPPVLPEWSPENNSVKRAAAAPVAAKPPKRKVRRKSVLCEELDPATIQTVEDLVDKYLVKLQTPENESEATCPESLAELKEYIALEITDDIRRMRFLRVAQIQETVYWLWKLYDEGGSPCYAYVARTPQAVEMGVADAFESTPEQFLYLTHFDLYNLYFE